MASGDGTDNESALGEPLSQRIDSGNIPINDQYLFSSFGEHDAPPLESSSFTLR
jgi:hypothetical protein